MFGLCNAPENFQHVMEDTIADLDGVIAYIDDLLVFGRDKEEHDLRLKKLLERLEGCGARLNVSKCRFGVEKLDFLGHTISAGGILPKQEKIDQIKNWRAPNSKEEVRSLLGLVQYVGARFIPNLIDLTEPLRALLGHGAHFSWGVPQQTAFDVIKSSLDKIVALGFYSISDRTQLYADASSVALGAVLIQIDSQNQPRVIAYASKSLSVQEKKLSQTEKEAMALVWGCERFSLYLVGRFFDLVTDHKPLESIFGSKPKASLRLERLPLRIQAFNFKVVYVPGRTMLADVFSRLCENPETCQENTDEEVFFIDLVKSSLENAITFESLRNESIADDTFIKAKSSLSSGLWDKEDKELTPFRMCASEFYLVDEILMRDYRIVVPASLRLHLVKLAHEGCPGINRMLAKLRERFWFPGMSEVVKKWIKDCVKCNLISLPDPPQPMTRTLLPDTPWSFLGIDLFGPLPSGEHILAIIDYFSRYLEVKILKDISAAKVISALSEVFARLGLPNKMLADNGRQFAAKEFHDYCKANGIVLVHSPPYYPRVNGEIERQMRSIKKGGSYCFEYWYLLEGSSTAFSFYGQNDTALDDGKNASFPTF